jgi:hypothetical protein
MSLQRSALLFCATLWHYSGHARGVERVDDRAVTALPCWARCGKWRRMIPIPSRKPADDDL